MVATTGKTSPTPTKPAPAGPPALKGDNLLHQLVVTPADAGTPAFRTTKCGKLRADGVLRSIGPRPAFLREGRRIDPTAETAGKVPGGVCPDCWDVKGDGHYVRTKDADKPLKKQKKASS